MHQMRTLTGLQVRALMPRSIICIAQLSLVAGLLGVVGSQKKCHCHLWERAAKAIKLLLINRGRERG